MDRSPSIIVTATYFPPTALSCVVAGACLAATFASPLLLVGWASMLVNCAAIFLLLKHSVWTLSPRASRSASPRERAEFYLLWPGMDVAAFLTRSPPPTRNPYAFDWAAAVVKVVLAAVCFGMLLPYMQRGHSVAIGVAGMLCGVLLFHSGLFHLVALVWRRAGRAVKPIMNAPLAASSLAEFWGRRWNLAFRDAAALLIFRPTARRWSVATATLATFLASGLLHDAVISLPARGGYGLPTLYFLLQCAGLMIERTLFGSRLNRWKRLGRRALTAVVVIVPLPLLFHQPFAENVILPLLHLLNAQ
jgi:Membrane bound O-acyl transferase family